jgi:YHS domain-containing protein
MNKIFSLLLVSFIMPVLLFAQQGNRLKHYNLEKGLAIEGYDPVSYFSGKPKEGSPKFSYTYEGVTYHFINDADLQTFKQNPAKYEPQYGGWCAYAMGSTGEKVDVDPDTYKIIDGKLFLFYNKYFNNTLKSWNKDEKALKAKADANWTKYK